MKKLARFSFIIYGCIVIYSCTNKKSENSDPEIIKKEIAQAEKDFEKMAGEKGIADAFWYFADSNAVIKRQHDTLILGKEGIKNYYSTNYFKTSTVTWSPDFVDVSGELGYTYGKYEWQTKDSTGKTEESSGVFHTVWKKQKDGSWKYVWD